MEIVFLDFFLVNFLFLVFGYHFVLLDELVIKHLILVQAPLKLLGENFSLLIDAQIQEFNPGFQLEVKALLEEMFHLVGEFSIYLLLVHPEQDALDRVNPEGELRF